MGYEIAKAEEWGKPVLALFSDNGTRRLSAIIDGSPKTKVFVYSNIHEAMDSIKEFIDSVTVK